MLLVKLPAHRAGLAGYVPVKKRVVLPEAQEGIMIMRRLEGVMALTYTPLVQIFTDERHGHRPSHATLQPRFRGGD